MKGYEVLELAAEYIEKNGWHKGASFGPRRSPDLDETACLVGSFCKVIGTDVSQERLYGGAYKLMQSVVSNPRISQWNDAPGRTKQEVLDALQKAAKLGRIREDINDSL